MRGLKLVICGLTLFGATAVEAAECPGNPTALGTSRTIVVDPTEHPRLGTMQYRETLPLEDHEVVLTFDDGPLPPRSNRILEILASECVKATYFMVGRMARSFPDMVRRIHEAGHTIGTHSQSHPLSFHRMTVERAQQEINDGIASVTWALGDGTAPAPFFRIPGLLRADGVERYLASQHLMVWSADFPADDWTRISPAQVYTRALQRIEANRKGILLLHDIQPRTVEALPYLLRELKRRGYRIVHIVPARPDLPKTVTDPRQWIMHARQVWPRVPIYVEAESESELPAPSPSSFGVGSRFDSRSVTRAALPRPRTVLARRQIPLPPVSIWPRSLDEPPPAPPSSGRPVLPAPSPQSFGYPADTPTPLQPKASLNVVPSFNLVPETTGKEIDIRRLILESERASEDPAATGSVPAPLLRDPAATVSVPPPPREPAPTAPKAPTAQMPRGAFP
jgi:peptidoglycan/xylan/chitin deacetylase (PgdA/CDA1 family)